MRHDSLQKGKIKFIKQAHTAFKDLSDDSFEFIDGEGAYSSDDNFCVIKINGKEEFFIKIDNIANRNEYHISPRDEALYNFLTFKTIPYKHPEVHLYEKGKRFMLVSRHGRCQDKQGKKNELTLSESEDAKEFDLDNFVRKHAIDCLIYGNPDARLDNSVSIKKDTKVKLYTIDVLSNAEMVKQAKDKLENGNVCHCFMEALEKVKKNMDSGKIFYQDMLDRITQGNQDKIILSALQKLIGAEKIIVENISLLREDKTFQNYYNGVKLSRKEAIDNYLELITENATILSEKIQHATQEYNEKHPDDHILTYEQQRLQKGTTSQVLQIDQMSKSDIKLSIDKLEPSPCFSRLESPIVDFKREDSIEEIQIGANRGRL